MDISPDSVLTISDNDDEDDDDDCSPPDASICVPPPPQTPSSTAPFIPQLSPPHGAPLVESGKHH